jgi:acyl carrier protein phosphodiesterase
MNYLAHSFLAFGESKLLAGQFLADDIKGNKYLNYPTRISQGIQLHRFVDHFTDTHELNLEIRRLLRPELGLFSSVAIDVYFDHILAKKWSDYHEQPCDLFIEKVYQDLSCFTDLMGEKRLYIFNKMKENNWLGSYRSLSGTQKILEQMSRRIPGGTVLLKSTDLLEKNMNFIQEVFEIFFPQLISAAKLKLDTFAP